MLHTISPIYDKNSRVLILGSFPSVKSRDIGFYYGHPQNRFWRVISFLLGRETPDSKEEKRAMLLENNIALWDVIASCDIVGSDDGSIRNVTANDLGLIIGTADIGRIFTNGGTAFALYGKFCRDRTGIPAIRLPSTSPANAGYSLDRLIKAWESVIDSIK